VNSVNLPIPSGVQDVTIDYAFNDNYMLMNYPRQIVYSLSRHTISDPVFSLVFGGSKKAQPRIDLSVF